jgi:hypothetical protein
MTLSAKDEIFLCWRCGILEMLRSRALILFKRYKRRICSEPGRYNEGRERYPLEEEVIVGERRAAISFKPHRRKQA